MVQPKRLRRHRTKPAAEDGLRGALRPRRAPGEAPLGRRVRGLGRGPEIASTRPRRPVHGCDGRLRRRASRVGKKRCDALPGSDRSTFRIPERRLALAAAGPPLAPPAALSRLPQLRRVVPPHAAPGAFVGSRRRFRSAARDFRRARASDSSRPVRQEVKQRPVRPSKNRRRGVLPSSPERREVPFGVCICTAGVEARGSHPCGRAAPSTVRTGPYDCFRAARIAWTRSSGTGLSVGSSRPARFASASVAW